jgi:hypothetical protein
MCPTSTWGGVRRFRGLMSRRTTAANLGTMNPRIVRLATALLLAGAAIYVFKFVVIALFGSEERWAQHVEGISFVVATPLQLLGVGMTSWLLTRGRVRAMRIAAALGAAVAWFLLIGFSPEVVLSGIELEWPLLMWAGVLVGLATLLRRLATALPARTPQPV